MKLNINNYFSFILIYDETDRYIEILKADNIRYIKIKVILNNIRISSSRKDALLKVNCNLNNTTIIQETIDYKLYIRNVKLNNLLKSEKQE